MILILLLIALGFLLWFPFTRSLILHPFKAIFYCFKDIFLYFKYKQFNIPSAGFIDCYCGLFGQGKTVSAVQRIRKIYKLFNGKRFYIPGSGWQTVKINILSNVEFKGIPYTKLDSLQQIVDWTAYAPEHRNEFQYVLIDESSAILNSRDFAKNFDFYSINALVTCRHYNLGLILTSQRFLLIDKLAREVCQTVFQCKKTWRVIVHGVYDAYELENASNPTDIKPKTFKSIFCDDAIFNTYDTLATVGRIAKDCEEGRMMSPEEILTATSPDVVPVPVKKLIRKLQKK